MKEVNFIKVVCVDEDDPFEYKVLEDANRGTIEEVCAFIKEKMDLYPNAKWMLLPETIITNWIVIIKRVYIM